MATSSAKTTTTAVVDPKTVIESRKLVNYVYVDDGVKDYIVSLIHATRQPGEIDPGLIPLVRAGASPRGTINLTLAAKAAAFLQGRGYVVPQDVKDLAHDVLRHRILLSYEAEAEEITSEEIVGVILDRVPVP